MIWNLIVGCFDVHEATSKLNASLIRGLRGITFELVTSELIALKADGTLWYSLSLFYAEIRLNYCNSVPQNSMLNELCCVSFIPMRTGGLGQRINVNWITVRRITIKRMYLFIFINRFFPPHSVVD